MDFKAKIEAAQKDLDDAKNNVAEIMALADVEERELSDEEGIKLEALTEDVSRLTTRIGNLEKAEKALGAKVIREKAPGIVKPAHLGSHKERKPADLVFKHATTAFLAHTKRMNPMDVVQKYYNDDQELGAIIKSIHNPAMTDVAGWAQELTDDAIQGFQDLLRGESAAFDCIANAGISLNFAGYTSIRIPARQGTTTDLAPSWTAEGQPIPVKSGQFGEHIIAPYKWGVISTFSKELSERSTPEIESLLRQFIIQDAGTQADANFWSGDVAVPAVRPAGILQGVVGTASTGNSAENMTQDLRNLLDPIISNDMGRNIRIYMHPSIKIALSSVLTATGVYLFRDELMQNRLWGYPVVASTNLPTDEYYAIDCAELAAALGSFDFDVSDTATLVEIDDDGVAPFMGADETPRTPSGTVGGETATPQTPPAPIRSLYQTHAVGLKLVNYISWHRMRGLDMVGRITGVAY